MPNKTQAQVDAEIAEFVKNGGEIQQIPYGLAKTLVPGYNPWGKRPKKTDAKPEKPVDDLEE